MIKLYDSLFPPSQVWKGQSGRVHIPVTTAVALALACPIVPLHVRKTPIDWPNRSSSRPSTSPVFCGMGPSCLLGLYLEIIRFPPICLVSLAFPHKSHVPATEVATRALYWTQPSQVYMIQELVIPVCELSSPFAFFPLHFCYLRVRKFYCSVTSSSVSGKNTNTSICSVLCSLHNDITHTNLF